MEKCEDEGSGWKWWSWTELSPVSYMLLNGFMGQIKSNETIQINWGQPSVAVNWSSYIEVTLISDRQHHQHSLTLSDSFFTKTTIIPPQYIVSNILHCERNRTKQRVTKYLPLQTQVHFWSFDAKSSQFNGLLLRFFKIEKLFLSFTSLCKPCGDLLCTYRWAGCKCCRRESSWGRWSPGGRRPPHWTRNPGSSSSFPATQTKHYTTCQKLGF